MSQGDSAVWFVRDADVVFVSFPRPLAITRMNNPHKNTPCVGKIYQASLKIKQKHEERKPPKDNRMTLENEE